MTDAQTGNNLSTYPPMAAISLHQPWASLIAAGIKTIETRSWPTSYRGPLAIHAAKTDRALAYLAWEEDHLGDFGPLLQPFRDRLVICEGRGGTVAGVDGLPLGAIVATCNLVACELMGEFNTLRNIRVENDGLWLYSKGGSVRRDISDQEPFGDFKHGRFGWLLEDIKPVEPPIPAKGRQQLWHWGGLNRDERGTDD